MPIKYEKPVSESLPKQIAENLRSAILSGDLKVDDRLPTEEELAARYSVSRPTIREALKRLAAQNLIRSRRGPAGGTFVKRPSQQEFATTLTNSATMMVTLGEFDLTSIVEARREMQQLCLSLAIERRTEQQLATLADVLERQQQPISDEEFCAADIDFHRAIIDATANPVLQFNMYTVIEALQPLTNMIANRYRQREVIIDFHQQLLDALTQQQAEQASATLNQLIDYLSEQYSKARQRNEQASKA